MIQEVGEHQFDFEDHLGLVEIAGFLTVLVQTLGLGVWALVSVNFNSKMAYII